MPNLTKSTFAQIKVKKGKSIPILLSGLLVTTVLLILFSSTKNFPKPGKALQPRRIAFTNDAEEIEIVIWARGDPHEHWRVDGPVKAAEQVIDFNIKAIGVIHPPNSRYDWQELVKAAEAGQGPDIVFLDNSSFPRWVEAGFLVPFEKCRARHPEYEDILDKLWQFSTWQGQIWGVPQEINLVPLYFNKAKLKEIGWTDQEIADLPEKIKLGLFTWDDLITTSKAAIDRGVIEPGFGFWYRSLRSDPSLTHYLTYGGRVYDPDKDKFVLVQAALRQWYAFQHRLIEEGVTLEEFVGPEWHPNPIGRTLFHDGVAHGRVLFWTDGIWQWWRWRKEYAADLGGDDYLYRFVGYALYPAGYKGGSGFTYMSVGSYAITSKQVSGRTHQAAACALLAKTSTPKINNLHAIGASRLGVLKSQANDADYIQNAVLMETRYMLDYSWSYKWPPLQDKEYQTYITILWHYMIKAENGEMLPAEAATAAIEQLQQELGNDVIIE